MDDDSVLGRSARDPDLTVAYADGPEHVADVHVGAAGSPLRPLVLLLHGGYWRPGTDRRHTRPMAAALADAGRTVAAVEYRRRPGHPDATLADVGSALAALPGRVGGHDGRVVVVGHSAGGQLALWAASQRPAPGLVGTLALAPVADLVAAAAQGLGGGAVAAFAGGAALTELDPRQLPTPATAVTLLHGDRDGVVPVDQSHAYHRAHPTSRLVEVRGAGHFAPIDPRSRAWLAVLAELTRLEAAG